MYIPKQFEQHDSARLYEVIRRYPLGTLVTLTPDGLTANHIPFVLNEASSPPVLHGHVARANPVWRAVSASAEALVIFHGPNAYISPAWYATKREHGKVVPTWNYVVVHAHGTIRAIDDPAWLRANVEALTQEHEGGRESPWAVSDAPAGFVDQLLAAIVGLEITVTRLVGKWKVSQNRPEQDRTGVIEGLKLGAGCSELEMAALIEQTLK